MRIDGSNPYAYYSYLNQQKEESSNDSIYDLDINVEKKEVSDDEDVALSDSNACLTNPCSEVSVCSGCSVCSHC